MLRCNIFRRIVALTLPLPHEGNTMYEQINTQVLALSKSFADNALKAHSLAMEGFERITALQLKTLENRVSATVEFLSEAAEVRDFDGLKTIWPKSMNLVKETTEKFYANGQEVFGVSLKTSEALGQLAKGSFEAANDNFTKQVNAVKKAAK
jgi:phasin family protein